MNAGNRIRIADECDMRPALEEALAVLNFEETDAYDAGCMDCKVRGNRIAVEVVSGGNTVNHTETAEYAEEIRRKVIKAAVLALCEAAGVNTGRWGILRGVRPTKLAESLITRQDREYARAVLLGDCLLEEETVNKLLSIAGYESAIYRQEDITGSSVCLYVSIPFCPSRCAYCSFPSWPLPDDSQIAVYLDALRAEYRQIKQLAAARGLDIKCIYVGGGTPASLPDCQFERMLADIREHFPQVQEFTVECGRPELIRRGIIEAVARHSVSRICVNPQTMNDGTLAKIGRQHSAADVIKAFEIARAGFAGVINMDLIAGLEGESFGDFQRSFECVAALEPENITVHTLALKRGSRLIETGSFAFSEDVLKMLDYSYRRCCASGYRPYYLYRQKRSNGENTGYCRAGSYSLYNMLMIGERHSVFGAGAAAATKAVFDKTLKSVYNPKDYRLYTTNLKDCFDKKRRIFEGC